MKKSEELKTRRKIKFKCFLLAHILTLFFALAPASPAGGNFSFAADLPAEEVENNSYFGQKNAYSEPFSKLIEFLKDKKEELDNYDGNFIGAKVFLNNNNSNLSALPRRQAGDEAGEANFAAEFNPNTSSFLASVLASVKDVAKNVFDSAKSFVFTGDNPNSFEYLSPTSEENAKEIENLKQQYEEAIKEANELKQKFALLQNEMGKIKAGGVIVKEPVIEQRMVEKTVEKIVSGLSQADLDSGIASLKSELANLNTNLTNQINNLSASASRQTSAVYNAVSLTNKIDTLSGTRLSNITVSGVAGLADSDIPDTITASNYLPLVGGTLTGALTGTSASFSSTLTVSASTTFNGIEYKWPSADGSVNQALVTNGAGGLSWTTISGGSNWNQQTNYGVLALTASTTIPYWAKDAFYASSTSVFQGLATFGNASTSQISATNSYLGTVLSGAWNGTSISNQYGGTGLDSSALTGLAQIVAGTWSASSTLSAAYGGTGWNSLQANTLLLGNGAGRLATTSAGADGYVLALSAGVPTWLATSTLSTITGTLTVAKGGTGQTSFGQGWLHSDGTTLSASTSPTVNYITATSTTATSTFPYLSVTTNSNLGTVVGGTWQGTAVGDAYLAKSGDWTGTLDTYEAANLLARANHTGTQGVATLSNYDISFSNNYGTNNLTASTTMPWWAQGGLNASSTSHFVYASTTALTISGNSYLGTVSSGAWNGTVVSNQYGGTGLDSSALTGLAQIVAGTWSASSTLSTAFGGTGWNNIASGYAIFGNGAGALSTSTSFYWDNSNSRLGIGTTTPDSKLTVYNGADDSAIEFSSASGGTYKWTMGLDYSDAGKFKIASSTALGSIDRFTIDGNGYVGIGTSTPARRLDVADSGNNNPQVRLSRETNIYTDLSVAQTTGDLSLSLYGTNADDISLFMPDGSTGANLWVCEGAACPNGISFTGGGNLFVEGVIKYATSTTPKTRRSIILTAAGAIVPTASGAAKTQVDGTNHSYYVLDFDASSDEAAFWQWTMPDSYDNGSIDITYYWEAGATSGDSILCFQAKGLSANSAEDIDSALSSAVCETDTAQANANDLASMTETNATSNFAAGEYATFKVFRDADTGGDTMTGDARLVKVKIEYGVATESD